MKPIRTVQQGVILLEALIGILIFSIGVLSLVAMQSVAIRSVSNAQYRAEAAFLANEILGQIWVDRGVGLANVSQYVYSGGSATGALGTWVTKVNALLPSSATYSPTIQVNNMAGVAAREVIVTMRWKAPDASGPSNHVAIGYVSDP